MPVKCFWDVVSCQSTDLSFILVVILCIYFAANKLVLLLLLLLLLLTMMMTMMSTITERTAQTASMRIGHSISCRQVTRSSMRGHESGPFYLL